MQAIEVYQQVLGLIGQHYAKPCDAASKLNAKTTLVIIYALYFYAEKLGKEVEGLGGAKGKLAVSNFIEQRADLLKKGGEFIPQSAGNAHLLPSVFIPYIKTGMEFFTANWESAPPDVRVLMIMLLAHDTLTYPRLVSYIQKWVPPAMASLDGPVCQWLYSPLGDPFSGTPSAHPDAELIADHIRTKWAAEKVVDASYNCFWSNVINLCNKAFTLKNDKVAIHTKIKSSRTQLYEAFNELISTAEIDDFIDNRYAAAFEYWRSGGL